MNISHAQITNPGILKYDDERKKRLKRFKEAVNRSSFLKDKEQKEWKTMGYILTNEQLRESEILIIDEDLRRLRTRHQLEKIKPKEK